MAVSYDGKQGSWQVECGYRMADGTRARKHKRGFATQEEAESWETSFLAPRTDCETMAFSDFWEVYRSDRYPSLKPSTRANKDGVARALLLPAFGNSAMGSISPADVLYWSNAMLARGLSRSYAATALSQLSAVFTHAMRFYDLGRNPVAHSGLPTSKEAGPRRVWGKDEYLKFSEAVSDKPASFMAFEILYWCGLRRGELLALTPDDVDFARGELSVTKTLARIDGHDVVTTPKTPRSMRRVTMPRFLAEELADYLRAAPCPRDGRMFPFTAYYLAHEMQGGCAASGMPRIRIHDIRHSHVSLLCSMGVGIADIAERMGHSKADVTLRYAHVLPRSREDVAARLDGIGGAR